MFQHEHQTKCPQQCFYNYLHTPGILHFRLQLTHQRYASYSSSMLYLLQSGLAIAEPVHTVAFYPDKLQPRFRLQPQGGLLAPAEHW